MGPRVWAMPVASSPVAGCRPDPPEAAVLREGKPVNADTLLLSRSPLLSPEVFFGDPLSADVPAAPEMSRSLADYLATVEREFIQGVLKECDGQITRTAEAPSSRRSTAASITHGQLVMTARPSSIGPATANTAPAGDVPSALRNAAPASVNFG